MTKQVSLPFEAVIFDMDGTLIASTEADYLAWKKLFEEHNKSLSFREYVPLLGIKSAEVISRCLQLEGESLNAALKRKFTYFEEVIEANGIHPVPHADMFLQNVKQYPVKLALATSSRREKMKLVMQQMNFLKYFDLIVTGEEVLNGKPFPDIFLIAAQRLGVSPDKCLVIEDAVNGVEAAKNANMKCIAITTTHASHLLEKADLIIPTFEKADLKDLCEQLGSLV